MHGRDPSNGEELAGEPGNVGKSRISGGQGLPESASGAGETAVPALFFIPALDVGGAERTCIHLVNNVSSFKPLLICYKPCGPLAKELRADVKVIKLSAPLSPAAAVVKSFTRRNVALRLVVHPFVQAHSLIRQARCIARTARRERADLVVSFLTIPNILAILAKIFFYPDLRVVVNVHDTTSELLMRSGMQRYKRVAVRLLIRWLYPGANRVVAVAHGIKQDLIRSFGIPAERIFIAHNPIDIETVRAKAAEPLVAPSLSPPGRRLLVAVGCLEKIKGFASLIRTVPSLPDDVSLAIIGDGSERTVLETFAEECGVRKRVHFLGFQPNPWQFMACADIFILSSLTEGFPNVVGEAMALGLPIVATDCAPSLREYLGEEEAGLIVPLGDISGMAAAINRLLANDALREKLGRRGYLRIVQFDLAKGVEAFEKVLRAL